MHMYIIIILSGEMTTMVFSYSVIWHPSDVAWASRWDSYLRMSDVQIHWFAICNSVAIVLFLSGRSKLTLLTCIEHGCMGYV